MKQLELSDAVYAVNGLKGYTLTEALKLWKAKYETVKHFLRDVIIHPKLQEFGDFVEEIWETITPVSVREALIENNLERRRNMFQCIGVARLFKELDPVLLDKQTIPKIRLRWNEQNEIYEYRYADTYELYELDSTKLFPVEVDPFPTWPTENAYAVRCWCTTTFREYWIYVPHEVALNKRSWEKTAPEPDAVRAIAWTIRIDISHPERIYRQGDIIVVKESEQSKVVTPYHLTKEQYLELMYSET